MNKRRGVRLLSARTMGNILMGEGRFAPIRFTLFCFSVLTTMFTQLLRACGDR
jgi:hypothetical protein